MLPLPLPRFWTCTLPLMHRLTTEQLIWMLAAAATLEANRRRGGEPQVLPRPGGKVSDDTGWKTPSAPARPPSTSKAIPQASKKQRASLIPKAWASHALSMLDQHMRQPSGSSSSSSQRQGSHQDVGIIEEEEIAVPPPVAAKARPIVVAVPPPPLAAPSLTAKQLLQVTWAMAEGSPMLWPPRPLRARLLAAATALLRNTSSDGGGSSGLRPGELAQLPLRLALAGVTRDLDRFEFFAALQAGSSVHVMNNMSGRQVGALAQCASERVPPALEGMA